MSNRRKNNTHKTSIDGKTTSKKHVDLGVRPSQAVSVLVDYYTVLAMVLGQYLTRHYMAALLTHAGIIRRLLFVSTLARISGL